jgi:hypothetical protein
MFGGLQTLRERAAELALIGLTQPPSVTNERWSVAPEELREVSIRWPETYQWPTARLWVDQLLYGFKQRVRLESAPLPQPYKGTVLFQLIVRNRPHDVAIDYSDYPEINEESVARCPVYFKMQHLRAGYGHKNVLPGGYVTDSRKIYLNLQRLRRIRDRRDFAYDVYGRFSTEFAGETRRRAVEILGAQEDFKFEGGMTKVSYANFLKDVARARICIDLPGQGNFCFRLINYFAVGACVVAARHGNILNAPLVDRVHIAYARDDFSDLIELCKFYLENDQAREAMCLKSRQFFEENLHKDNLTTYYLRSCLDRLRN